MLNSAEILLYLFQELRKYNQLFKEVKYHVIRNFRFNHNFCIIRWSQNF